jgi:hypothetical protein
LCPRGARPPPAAFPCVRPGTAALPGKEEPTCRPSAQPGGTAPTPACRPPPGRRAA